MGIFGVSERRAREIARQEAERLLLVARYKLIDDKGDEVSLDLGGSTPSSSTRLYIVRAEDS